MLFQLSPLLRIGVCLGLGVGLISAAGVAVAQSENTPSGALRRSKKVAPQPQPVTAKEGETIDEETEASQGAKPAQQPSIFFPDWKPNAPGFGLRPVLGFQYSSDSRSGAKVGQGEFGLYAFAKGINVVPGNPGLQFEPGFGYALGAATVQQPGEREKSGSYRRIWGGLQAPVYYRFVRQLFGVNYGLVSGGPLPLARRFQFVSDTGVAVLPHISAHYTLTYDRTFGDGSAAPELNSYDHWLHGRLSAGFLNFFIDAGPGFSTSKLSQSTESLKVNSSSSETYLLARSGLDLFTDKIGFDAQAKYIISATSKGSFESGSVRSPLDDLGGDARRVGLPEDSFHASAFLGLRRVFAGVGIGWRYTLEILNMNERNNTKQQKTESNGLGIFASVNF